MKLNSTICWLTQSLLLANRKQKRNEFVLIQKIVNPYRFIFIDYCCDGEKKTKIKGAAIADHSKCIMCCLYWELSTLTTLKIVSDFVLKINRETQILSSLFTESLHFSTLSNAFARCVLKRWHKRFTHPCIKVVQSARVLAFGIIPSSCLSLILFSFRFVQHQPLIIESFTICTCSPVYAYRKKILKKMNKNPQASRPSSVEFVDHIQCQMR